MPVYTASSSSKRLEGGKGEGLSLPTGRRSVGFGTLAAQVRRHLGWAIWPTVLALGESLTCCLWRGGGVRGVYRGGRVEGGGGVGRGRWCREGGGGCIGAGVGRGRWCGEGEIVWGGGTWCGEGGRGV